MYRIKRLSISVVFILTGCVSLAPAYQRPALPVASQFSLSQGALVEAGSGYQDSGWMDFFRDPPLRALIGDTLRNNRDLRLAVLNVRQARAQFQRQDADRFPQVDATAKSDARGGLNGGASRTQYQTSADLRFDLDFFGRLKNMSEAEQQNFLATEQAQRRVHILLVSDMAQAYFNQQLAYAQLRIARETLQNYALAYAVIERQNRTGSANILALEQARGVIESTRTTLARRQGELAQANHAIQRLSGVYTALPPDGDALARGITPLALPPALPSTILLQRPDIIEAEHLLRAADANIGAARAAFFPAVSLTGELSSGSNALSSLFSAANGGWAFIPKIDLPIFNAGRNQANLELAEIRQQQSIVNYENRIQTSFKEVSDALALRESLTEQLTAQQRYLTSLQITLQRATQLYAHGVVSYIEVLDAERSLFSARQTQLDLLASQQTNEITLFAALGGGWKA